MSIKKGACFRRTCSKLSYFYFLKKPVVFQPHKILGMCIQILLFLASIVWKRKAHAFCKFITRIEFFYMRGWSRDVGERKNSGPLRRYSQSFDCSRTIKFWSMCEQLSKLLLQCYLNFVKITLSISTLSSFRRSTNWKNFEKLMKRVTNEWPRRINMLMEVLQHMNSKESFFFAYNKDFFFMPQSLMSRLRVWRGCSYWALHYLITCILTLILIVSAGNQYWCSQEKMDIWTKKMIYSPQQIVLVL